MYCDPIDGTTHTFHPRISKLTMMARITLQSKAREVPSHAIACNFLVELQVLHVVYAEAGDLNSAP